MSNTPLTARTLIDSHENPAEAYPVPLLFGEFTPAPDLENIGLRLVRKHFQFPETVAIHYLWKSHGGGGGGKFTLGKCVKASGLTGYFSNADFIIWVAADHVDELPLSRLQVEALLYHELCHISADEDNDKGLELELLKHDVEAFRAEIQEYGFWKTDLVAFGRTVQRNLPGFDGQEIPEPPAPMRPKGATVDEGGPDDLPIITEQERVTA